MISDLSASVKKQVNTAANNQITPGGKAAQANVMQGDVLVAVNGMGISDQNLHEIMKLIKDSGDRIHLTLLSQEDIQENLQRKRQSEANFSTATEMERPASNLPPPSPRAATPAKTISPLPESRSKTGSPVEILKQNTRLPISPLATTSTSACAEERPNPVPKPRTTVKTERVEEQACDGGAEATTKPWQKDYPDYIKRHLKPQKPTPEFKPQVNWLHGKLRINMKRNPDALSDPGNKLKTAAQAHPNQPIEIEGPLSATVVHAQYNTPVGLYSGSQIVNALVGTAAAKGAQVTDAEIFSSDDCVDVNTETPVYKLVHKQSKASPVPAQSRSIQILDAILSHPDATLPSPF